MTDDQPALLCAFSLPAVVMIGRPAGRVCWIHLSFICRANQRLPAARQPIVAPTRRAPEPVLCLVGVGYRSPRSRDENRSDTDGYHRYYICFHISVRIRIQIRIVSTMSDRIRLDIDIINIRFEYSDTDTVSDIEYPDLNMDN